MLGRMPKSSFTLIARASTLALLITVLVGCAHCGVPKSQPSAQERVERMERIDIGGK